MCARTTAEAEAAAASNSGGKNKNETMKIDSVEIAKRISAASASSFRKPAAFVPSYGTAGFRAEASLLDSTLFR